MDFEVFRAIRDDLSGTRLDAEVPAFLSMLIWAPRLLAASKIDGKQLSKGLEMDRNGIDSGRSRSSCQVMSSALFVWMEHVYDGPSKYFFTSVATGMYWTSSFLIGATARGFKRAFDGGRL